MSPDHQVTCFSAVPENTEEVLGSNPDIIFLDCMLPGESGRNFQAPPRRRPHERCAVILMSAYHEMMEEAKTMSHDFQEFLKKPCTIRQVMAVVQRYLDKNPQKN